jgi:DNA polymerase I-like protein with 3'-5' exonuclease and polymerase domains
MIWDDTKIVAADLETSGKLPEYALQPWRFRDRNTAWVTSASMIRFDAGRLVPHVSQLFPSRELLKRMLEDAIANDWWVLGWNIAYDISVLMALGPDIEALCFKVKWLDGMLIERHYDIEPEYEFQTRKHLKKSYSLKGYTDSSGRVFDGAVQRWIPTFAGLDEDIDFHSQDPADLARLQRYNDRDNVRAWTIVKMIWGKLTERQRAACLIQAEALPVVAQANLDGLVVDQLTARHLGHKLDADASAMLHDLAPEGMTEVIVRSPAKLGNLMFGDPKDPSYPHWGLPVLKENKSKVEGKDNSRSTDKEVLHELAFIDHRVAKVKAYREALNARGKFCDSVLTSVEYCGDGRTHPQARLFGTYTDRMTVSSKQGKGKDERPIGFALHQMKREAEFREIITVPPGYDLVEFDAAGQEFRWMAVASGDPTMLNLCLPGEDAHSYMGSRIVGMDYHDLIAKVHAADKAAGQTRYLGKFANLSLQYRTSARKLRVKARIDYDIPMELPEAQRIHATYQKTYPGVPVYWAQQIAIVKQLGYVETFGGNRVRVEGDWNGGWGWSMGSTAINTRIQGTGAEQKHLAIAVLKPYMQQVGARFMFDLHDGLYLAIPSAIRPKAVIEMKRLLDNLPYQQAWGFTPPIPMPWDCKVGIGGTPTCAWGRMKEQKFA